MPCHTSPNKDSTVPHSAPPAPNRTSPDHTMPRNSTPYLTIPGKAPLHRTPRNRLRTSQCHESPCLTLPNQTPPDPAGPEPAPRHHATNYPCFTSRYLTGQGLAKPSHTTPRLNEAVPCLTVQDFTMVRPTTLDFTLPRITSFLTKQDYTAPYTATPDLKH